MESVALSNVQLGYLAREDPLLKPYYRGALPCDGLPKNPRGQQSAYIVNKDKKGQPEKHWIARIARSAKSWTVADYPSPFMDPNPWKIG